MHPLPQCGTPFKGIAGLRFLKKINTHEKGE